MFKTTDIIHYLPEFLRGYAELKNIANAENAELDSIKAAAETVLNSAFIQTCDEGALSYFEELYGCFVSSGLSAEERRERCKAAVRLRVLPLTEELLREWANNRLNGLYEYELDYGNYTLSVYSDVPFGQEKNFSLWVDMWLRKSIPANIALKAVNAHTHGTLAGYTHEELAAYTHEQIAGLGV